MWAFVGALGAMFMVLGIGETMAPKATGLEIIFMLMGAALLGAAIGK